MTKYLLDVSSLIALGLGRHQFHDRVRAWVNAQPDCTFLTCSITELGFVRIIAQAQAYGFTITQARSVLLGLKKNTAFRFEFLPDGNDVSLLPNWVTVSRQTTDGHLVELAKSHGAILATLDEDIPGAYLIP